MYGGGIFNFRPVHGVHQPSGRVSGDFSWERRPATLSLWAVLTTSIITIILYLVVIFIVVEGLQSLDII